MNRKRHYRGGYQSAGLTEIARRFRRNGTNAESLLWEHLRNRRMCGFKFRRQHQFGDYVADFFCHEANLVVECDGSIHDANEQWHHDQQRDAWMIGQGLTVIRCTNEDILTDIELVLDRIKDHRPFSPWEKGRG